MITIDESEESLARETDLDSKPIGPEALKECYQSFGITDQDINDLVELHTKEPDTLTEILKMFDEMLEKTGLELFVINRKGDLPKVKVVSRL